MEKTRKWQQVRLWGGVNASNFEKSNNSSNGIVGVHEEIRTPCRMAEAALCQDVMIRLLSSFLFIGVSSCFSCLSRSPVLIHPAEQIQQVEITSCGLFIRVSLHPSFAKV